ncbi:hypothetical protein ACO0K7_08010 [Undibacterium sp. Ji67W]|uniref:hypothetical protein n=1 Tax=Undibacterium sp. Ji67W TaxID=3413042 RepID=UPI003BF17F83
MSISSIPTTPLATASTGTSGAPTATTPSTTTSTVTNNAPAAISSTANAGLVNSAVTLASESSIVSLLNGNQSSNDTYSASGLLSSFVNAGINTSKSSSNSTSANSTSSTQTSLQAAQNQAILASISTPVNTNNPNAALYAAIGQSQNNSSIDTTTNWANALKNNPAEAVTLTQDNLNLNIVSNISTTA